MGTKHLVICVMQQHKFLEVFKKKPKLGVDHKSLSLTNSNQGQKQLSTCFTVFSGKICAHLPKTVEQRLKQVHLCLHVLMHPMHVVLCLCAHVSLCVHVCCKPFIQLIFTLLFVQIHVQIKFPEPTKLGLEFLRSKGDETFDVYPEADMLLSMNKCTSYSTFTEWGKGWADPEIRRQRLERMRQNPDGSRGKQKQRKSRTSRKSRSRKSNKNNSDLRTVRGRIEAKLSKYK